MSLPIFVNMLNWGQGKVGVFDYRSGKSQGIQVFYKKLVYKKVVLSCS